MNGVLYLLQKHYMKSMDDEIELKPEKVLELIYTKQWFYIDYNE